MEVEFGCKRRLDDNDNLNDEKLLTKFQDEQTTGVATSDDPKSNESFISPSKMTEAFREIPIEWVSALNETENNENNQKDPNQNLSDRTFKTEGELLPKSKSLLEILKSKSESKANKRLITLQNHHRDNLKECENQSQKQPTPVFDNTKALELKNISLDMRENGNKVFEYLQNLREHVSVLKEHEKSVRNDLKARLLFKNKMNETYNSKISELDRVFKSKYGNVRDEKNRKKHESDQEAKRALDEIIHLRQREDEIVQHYEKLKNERQVRLDKKQGTGLNCISKQDERKISLEEKVKTIES